MRRALEICLILLLSGFGMYWLWRTPLMWCAELPVFVLLVVLNAKYPDWWKAPIDWILAILYYRRPDPAIQRREKGQCPKCGYDLIGNLSGTCPECGAEIDFLPPMVRRYRR
jgi:hypothetical protein